MANIIPIQIDREGVRALMQNGAQLVEVLSKAQYEKIHLEGAIPIPLDMIDQQVTQELKRDEPVIVYCYDDL